MGFRTGGAENVTAGCDDGTVFEVGPAADNIAAEDEGIHDAADVLDKLESGGGYEGKWGIVCVLLRPVHYYM